MADQNARADRAGFGGKLGVEQTVEADHGGKVRPVARRLQRGLTAHAKADRGHRQAIGMRAQRGNRSAQAGAVGFGIGAQHLRQRPAGLEAFDRLAIEIGDHREIALRGQHLRAPFHRRVDIGDGREDDDGGPRLADGRASQPVSAISPSR